jgi:hypothetical protein
MGFLLWVVWLYYTMDVGELSRDGGIEKAPRAGLSTMKNEY